ncbi:hypothetical protein [Deinococcus malanensis]|uniref:hypothetical protein n=1 Tax=Deinococcus malanensis TaxID=1706855 RepID=UPI003A91DCA8
MKLMLNAALSELLNFFSPLSALQREESGAVSLLTPGTNVLGLNATYLPDLYLPDISTTMSNRPAESLPTGVLASVTAWHAAHDLPLLLATAQSVAGAEPVTTLQIGTVTATGQADPRVVVEQMSRLHLVRWAEVLATARGTPQWGGALAQHLGRALEGNRDFVLLQAYQDGQPAGALLWRATAPGGATHLWGALTPEAGPALMEAAAQLGGGRVVASALREDPLSLQDPLPYGSVF